MPPPRRGCAAAAVALAALSRGAAAQQQTPKHVVWTVIDDWGWGDVSYKARTYPGVQGLEFAPPTPNIDALAMSGVRLESHYVHPLCSPSRTAFLSGRYAYTTGSNSEVIVDGVPDQLPTNYRTLADLLGGAGWNTSAYGKWDLGMTTWGCTPTCRGFQHFSGFYNAYNDYFTHHVGTGLDLRRDAEADTNQTGVYMTHLITARVSEWIAGVVAGAPSRDAARSFAYVAHQAMHAPQQVPAEYVDRCVAAGVVNATDQPIRAMACGQMVAVDDSVGAVVAAYGALGILNDTLFVFTADNGPNTDTGGSAWPLRGMKATTFEGGMRGVAFVSGAGLAPAVRGSVSHELYSLVDWLPTLAGGVAGVDLSQAGLPKHPGQPAPPPLDGMDVWASLSTGAPSPRTEALLQLDPVACFAGATTPCLLPGQGAYRAGQWKLMVGHTSTYAGPGNVTSAFCGPRDGVVQPNVSPLHVTPATTPPFCPTGWVPPPGSGLPIVPPPEEAGPGGACAGGTPCVFPTSVLNTGGVWLFDVVNDPWEQHNVAAAHPDVVAALSAKLAAFNATRIPQQHSATDPASDPAKHGGVWTPWRGNPAPAACDPNTTVPGAALRSNLDGVTWGAGAGAAPTAVIAGWAWDPLEDGGRAQLNVSIAMDGAPLGWVVASVDRPGLPSKTGAPDPDHGFAWALPPAAASAGATGKHAFAVTARAEGVDVPLAHSPVCYCDTKPCAC